jgi:GTP-binding protein
VTPGELKKQRDRLKRAANKAPLSISGVTGEGVRQALQALAEAIGEAPVSGKAKASDAPWIASQTPATPHS